MSRTFLSSSLTFSWSPWNSWRKEAWVPVVPCKHGTAGGMIGCSAPNICRELLLVDTGYYCRFPPPLNALANERLASSITCFCIRSRPTPLNLDSSEFERGLGLWKIRKSLLLTLAPLNMSVVHSLCKFFLDHSQFLYPDDSPTSPLWTLMPYPLRGLPYL